MPNRLENCSWPPLSPPYDAALREAAAFILNETDPLGIIASGTIVRGHPHASSDLDIWVVHHESYRRRVQRRFRGVPAEIFINPPQKIRAYFESEQRDGRLVTAHMLATGVIVYAADPVVADLQAEARHWLLQPLSITDEDLVRARYTAATWLEDGADIVDSDRVASAMLLTRAVMAMMEFHFISRRTPIPRSKELHHAIAADDAILGQRIGAFFATTSPAERLSLASEIADRMISARGFFEWDSGREPVPA